MNINAETPRTCSACGAELHAGNRFCANCGAAVAQVPQSEPRQPVSEPGVAPTAPEDDTILASTDSSTRQDSPSDTDPSSLDTREFVTTHYTPTDDPESHDEQTTETSTPYVVDDAGWGTPGTTVPPERGNRTLWIILGIIAVIVLICCCILPLGLMAIVNWDTGFQDELRSSVIMLRG